MALLKLRKRMARHSAGLRAAWHASGTIAREHGFSRFAMLAAAGSLLLRRRMAPDTYFQYRLFDPSVRPKEKYISEAPTANNRLWSTLTPLKYRTLFDNKYAFRQLFHDFPLARLHGVFDRQVGFTSDGRRLTNAVELAELIRELPDGFVFKPVDGMRANLTLVFGAPVNGQLRTLAGEPYDAARIIRATRNTVELKIQNKGASGTSFLIEERLKPHSSLAELIGPTFCTTRVVTIVARDGNPRIVGCVFKLLPGTHGVDLMRLGAIVAWVNADGTLTPGRTRTTYEWIRDLPGGKRFVGFQLPHWQQVRELAFRAARVFPWARAIGWDIGICEDGPRLLEGNERWSPSLTQLPAPHGIMDGELRAVYEALRA